MQNQETTQQPHLNEEHITLLISLSEENPRKLIENLLETYKTSWARHIESIKKACAEKDAKALRSPVHLINGSSANLGFQRLSLTCRRIEDEIETGVYNDFENCVQQLEEEYEVTLKKLEAFLERN